MYINSFYLIHYQINVLVGFVIDIDLEFHWHPHCGVIDIGLKFLVASPLWCD